MDQITEQKYKETIYVLCNIIGNLIEAHNQAGIHTVQSLFSAAPYRDILSEIISEEMSKGKTGSTENLVSQLFKGAIRDGDEGEVPST